MPAVLRPIGLNRTTEEELRALSESIDNHQRALHEEGVWLFLAVLGCWGVFPAWLRLCALIAAVFLFFQRYESYKSDRRSFPKQFAAARSRISAIAASEELRQEGIEQLDELERVRLGGLKPFYKVPGFIVGWVSFGVTFLVTGHAIVTHAA